MSLEQARLLRDGAVAFRQIAAQMHQSAVFQAMLAPFGQWHNVINRRILAFTGLVTERAYALVTFVQHSDMHMFHESRKALRTTRVCRSQLSCSIGRTGAEVRV